LRKIVQIEGKSDRLAANCEKLDHSLQVRQSSSQRNLIQIDRRHAALRVRLTAVWETRLRELGTDDEGIADDGAAAAATAQIAVSGGLRRQKRSLFL
jgi:hypothetical protein